MPLLRLHLLQFAGALTNHLDKKHPYINNEFVCKKCLNVFHTAEAKEFHDSICMMKENELRVVEYQHMINQSSGRKKTTTC